MVNSLNRRQKQVLRLIAANLLLLALILLWSGSRQTQTVNVAVAKGKQMLDLNMAAAPRLDVLEARRIAMEDTSFERWSIAAEDTEFVNAVLLSPGEARYWQESGCESSNCAHVTLYNHAGGGSIEAIVDMQGQETIASWANEEARPGGTSWILPRALEIAAADPRVELVLGNIGDAEPAMVPMSGWLADSACRTEWCVDLTFHDPHGSGKIFHVFVNMESDRVERTFYTRGREERSMSEPLAQRDAFTDGCHEAYDWSVCWEMTAHDGVDFQDATYQGQSIFRSAKIGQVEAWYPSWPGGYRDEIGFAASVPPFGDTIVNDLGDGFEVRQIFTEFTRWPNCICCYRYEQIARFAQDGTLEFHFLSHGPGCDDLSVYRPFWRIDVDLDGPRNDEVWLWEGLEWQEQSVEFEEHPVVEDVSPSGAKLATVDGDLHYRWVMEKTDPLGRDEGYLFLLQFAENEGTGPIVTGPGDTYIPPRQWIDGEALSGENIVLWHVPLLKTIKGNPWWCMPDPEPDFSPCDAVLRAVPAAEFEQLSPEERATTAAVVTETPTAPAPATAAPTPTPRPIMGSSPEEIVLNGGCTACHQIGELGETHKVGPDLSNIGWLAQGRVEGMSGETYIRQSILDPNIYLAPECPNGPCLANIMPRDYGQRLTEQQQEILVDFLLSLQEMEPAEPVARIAEDTPLPPSAGKTATPAPFVQRQELVVVRIASILLLSLVFLASLLVYFRGNADQEDN